MAHDTPITFVRAGIPYNEEMYWVDQNGDGRTTGNEIVEISNLGSWEENARGYIQSRPDLFLPQINWQPKSFDSYQEYFNHPEKTTFELQLTIDIGRLERMPNRPGIYSELLQDLYQIKDELQYTRFRYEEDSEMPEGILALYDVTTSTMITRHNPPTATLIHELDHALTTHRRVDRKALEQYPNYDQNLKTGFEFYLDYPLKENADDKPVTLYYDEIQSLEAFLGSPDAETPFCLTEANKSANLANEVHAFQSMARYWLYQMEVTDEELHSLRTGGIEKIKFIDSLKERCIKQLKGMNIDASQAYDILMHYFAQPGIYWHDDLRDYVKKVYTEGNNPSFVDTPGCIERPSKSSWSCGCSVCR